MAAETPAEQAQQDTETPQVSEPLPGVALEVEQFAAAAGWDQPPQLFALVSTSQLLAEQPELADTLNEQQPLTPVAQDSLPAEDLGAALAGIAWPDTVQGCALTQEIVVLPPEAEAELDRSDADGEELKRLAAAHPQRRDARLVAAALRSGEVACVLRLRETGEEPEQLVEDPALAPNLTAALAETLRA